MESAIDRLIEECVGALREGALSEQALRSAFADVAVEGGGRQDCIGRQDLLYLQCSTVGLDCAILGMRMVIDGEFDDGPDDPEDWPYKSVLDALKDGWRIVSFPDLGLLVDESKTFGLGHEFILEKWRCATRTPHE